MSMEYIKVAKVDDVILHRKGISVNGSLHLTTHHLIFTSPSLAREFWFSYPTIGSVFKNRGSALISKYKNHSEVRDDPLYAGKDIWSFCSIKVIGKDYTVFSLDFQDDAQAQDVYDSIEKLTVINDVSQLYAFIYTPNKAESPLNSWKMYDPLKEFKRQGLSLEGSCKWRVTEINHDYSFCKTYPNLLIVPTTVSDTLLTHAVKYRSQNRIPTLAYFYKNTGACIIRSSQPLPGLTQQRSVQDEKLVRESFNCSHDEDGLSTRMVKNIIVDARPTTNAMAQKALGGGSENMDNYNFGGTATRMFLGIDNIHVMRDTLNNLVDNFLVDLDLNLPIDKSMLNEGKASQWLKYVKLLLSSTETLTKSMLFNKSNLLIHCSDGWDRTTQVCSLIQICLDPFYRTIEGFCTLVEKDWLSFGHRFAERSGHLSSENLFHDNSVRMSISGAANNVTQSIDLNSSLFGSFSNGDKKDGNFGEMSEMDNSTIMPPSDLVNKVSKRFKKKNTLKLTSPIFQQFVDCVYQLQNQNPTQFEFNERFLRRLVYHLYSCQYGTFLFNNEQERVSCHAYEKTRSVWDYFKSRKAEFANPSYSPSGNQEEDWLLPDLNKVQWWWQLFGRRDEEMNGDVVTTLDEQISSEEEKKSSLRFLTFSLDIFNKK